MMADHEYETRTVVVLPLRWFIGMILSLVFSLAIHISATLAIMRYSPLPWREGE